MSDLDKRLEELELEFLHGVPVHLTSEMVEQIKQAFIADGWVKPVVLTREGSYRATHDPVYKTPELRTGQEWYERFEREVGQYEVGGWIDDTLDNVLLAARIAAGIEKLNDTNRS